MLQRFGAALLAVAGLAAAGCTSIEATELMIEVRTKDLHFAPDPEPADIDEIEIRVLRVIGSADDVVDAGPVDAGPVDAGTADAGPIPELDMAIVDAAVFDAAAAAPDGGPAPLAYTRCPLRAGTFVDGRYVYAEKSCGRYSIRGGARPPLTLGVVPADGESSAGQIEIRASGLLAGVEVVNTYLLAGFVPHTLRRVPPLVLSAGCVGRVCPRDLVCNDDVCVSVEVPPMCLPAAGVDAGPAWSTCGAVDLGPACGECMPSERGTDMEACGCGGSRPRERTCGAGCTWGPWSATGACMGESCPTGESCSGTSCVPDCQCTTCGAPLAIGETCRVPCAVSDPCFGCTVEVFCTQMGSTCSLYGEAPGTVRDGGQAAAGAPCDGGTCNAAGACI